VNVAYKQIRLAAPLKRPIRYVSRILSFCRLGSRLVRFQSIPTSVCVCVKSACERETLISFCQEMRLLKLERKAPIFLTQRRRETFRKRKWNLDFSEEVCIFLMYIFMPDRMKWNPNVIFLEMYVGCVGVEYNLIFETARSGWYVGRFSCPGQPTHNTQVLFTEMLCRSVGINWRSSPLTISVYSVLNTFECIIWLAFCNGYKQLISLTVLYLLLNYLML